MTSIGGATIGAGQRAALLEAFSAAAALVPQDLRRSFVLVGGASLLSLGGTRKTGDVDVAVTGPALHAFHAAALNDERFNQLGGESWEYTSSNEICVPFEFLLQGGDFIPVIEGAREIGACGEMRAGLGELAIMKAKTWLDRDEDKDLQDFRFLITKMGEMGETFGTLQPGDEEEMGDLETLKTVGEEVGGTLEGRLLKMLGL
jgi:hypothetical protein